MVYKFIDKNSIVVNTTGGAVESEIMSKKTQQHTQQMNYTNQ